MKKKHIYWIVILAILTALMIFIALLPNYDKTLLIIENAASERCSLSTNDIYTIKGIDFSTLRSSFEEINDYTVQHTISLLEKFYAEYSEEMGKSLIKVFYVDQIIQKSDLRDYTYQSLTFQSPDGKQVFIEPSTYEDILCLITLEKSGSRFFLRLIMPEDSNSQRWLQNVVKITME